MIVLKITLSAAVCQMTNVSPLADFVTESEKTTIPRSSLSYTAIFGDKARKVAPHIRVLDYNVVYTSEVIKRVLPVITAHDKLNKHDKFAGGHLRYYLR